ncbi:cytochrome c3 family protein [Geomonas sp. Red276]
MRKTLVAMFGMLVASAALWGCDPVTVHKVTSTIFDGVPAMPPAEQYCEDYHLRKLQEEKEAALKKNSASAAGEGEGSAHPPYKQKKCDNCHDKSKDSGLKRPKDQLCFMCHPKILKGHFLHGPAAVGACLECHDPHSSPNKSLMKLERAKLCVQCHREPRQAKAMHDKVTATGLFCMDCHDPHSGQAKYFLK